MKSYTLKLNLGGGCQKIQGYKNVDIQGWDGNTDIIHDLIEFPYPFDTNSVDEILTMELLEHISFKKTHKVLCEWNRILKSGGKLKIQVPDCGKMMEYYVNNEICECVPHKANRIEDFKPNPDCFNCQGKAKINSTRWLYSFTGAQKSEWDAHLNIFTKERMIEALKKADFTDIQFKEHSFKLIVNTIKKI